MSRRSPITTHVLDTSLGHPAAAVTVNLDQQSLNGWQHLSSAETDTDGRVTNFEELANLVAGGYRLVFELSDYFRQQSRPCFFPRVTIEFTVVDIAQHYHVPLLLSPFGYSTYRGS